MAPITTELKLKKKRLKIQKMNLNSAKYKKNLEVATSVLVVMAKNDKILTPTVVINRAYEMVSVEYSLKIQLKMTDYETVKILSNI